jgi:hypothetical protein
MISQEDVGEAVLEALEYCFYVLVSVEDSKDLKLILKASDNYKKAVANAKYYLITSKEEW